MSAERLFTLTRAAHIRTARQPWLIPGLIPLGTITLCAGRGGAGKSSWVLSRIAELTHGRLEGDIRRPAEAIIAGPEDDWSAVMNPRLIAAGANLEKVSRFEIKTTIENTTLTTNPVLPLDIGELRQAIELTGAKLVMLDPASSLIAGDLNKREDVRAAMDRLAILAQDTQCAVVLIAHFNKGQGVVGDKISGSTVLRDAARSVLVFAEDEETGERIVTVDKSNYSANTGDSFAFTLEPVTIPTDDGHTTEVARVIDLGRTDRNVSDLINRGFEDDHEDRNAAQAFILDYLSNVEAYEANAGEVLKAGRAAGFSEQELKDARRRCRSPRVASVKSGFGAGWVWRLHEGGSEGGLGGRATEPATFATLVPPTELERLPDWFSEDQQTTSTNTTARSNVTPLSPRRPS